MSKIFAHRTHSSTDPFLSIGRLTYLTFSTLIGLFVGLPFTSVEWLRIGLGGFSGFAIGCLALWLEIQLSACSRSAIAGGSLGLLVGITGSSALVTFWHLDLPGIPPFFPWGFVPSILLFPYLGLALGLQYAQTESDTSPSEPAPESAPAHQPQETTTHSIQKLLDSSAIIDGRILSLCTTGFLEGPFMVPKSILHELQALADSNHFAKRTKGKRGLDILTQLQQLPNIDVAIIEDWEPDISAVDHQLLAIAKNRRAKIVTNDWNLARIASLQGVLSLNVNELTYQLRPLVLPGETIRVYIHKEGQGHEQGIAHLDDGTMVVVDHGATLVGQTIKVMVTRFMQTNTGRMIFSTPQSNPSSLSLNLQPLPPRSKVISEYSCNLVEDHD